MSSEMQLQAATAIWLCENDVGHHDWVSAAMIAFTSAGHACE
jgi:hypothetical protein